MSNKKPPLYMTPSSIANAIIMTSGSDRNKCSLIFEGSTDSELFSKLLNKENCFIYCAGGYKNKSAKKRVIEVVKILQDRSFSGFLAVVDADLEHVEGYIYTSSNLVRTDTYNTESMMLKSAALDLLLNKNSSFEKLRKYQERYSIREKLLASSIIIGFLRLINKRNNWGMSFKHMSFKDFICNKTLTIDQEELIMNLSGLNLRDFFELEEELETIKPANEDPWLICNGHDMMDILLIGFKHIFGEVDEGMNRYKLESKLRSEYNINFFEQTSLYIEIKKWEQTNTSFKILH